MEYSVQFVLTSTFSLFYIDFRQIFFEPAPQIPEGKNRLLFYTFTPRYQRLIGRVYWWSYIYHLTKYYELIDSVIIVLRKPAKGLTHLHVLHHMLMMMMVAWWFAADFGAVWMPAFFNSFVHIIMYLYYGMNSLGMRWKIRSWITSIQLVQFIMGVVYFVIYIPGRVFFNMDASGNLYIMTVSSFVDMYFFWLFYDFYKKEYKSRARAKSQRTAQAESKQADTLEKGQAGTDSIKN